MQTAAKHVIEKCGGFGKVADWLNLNLSTVYRFTYSSESGGTDGIIPAQHQITLLAKARENGIDLRPDDFFAGSADVSPPIAPDQQPDQAVGASK